MRSLWYWKIAFAMMLMLLLPITPASAAETQQEDSVIPLPQRDLFRALIADLKQPRFAMSILHIWAPSRDTTGWVASVGENFGLVRWPGAAPDNGIQLNLSGAVFAQFDLGTPSADLINADYIIGFPLTYRRDRFSGRFRIYHQSSHLGDEFLLNANPVRVNLSFESAEMLLSYEVGPWRAYGGGEYIFRRDPSDLKPGLLHGGLEYRYPVPLLRVSGLGSGYWVVALDIKSWQEDDWSPAWNGKTGIEFTPVRDGEKSGRRLSFLVEGYHGFAPYGQFFVENVSYLGFEIQLSL